jgi:hypothetical protein
LPVMTSLVVHCTPKKTIHVNIMNISQYFDT